MSEKTREPGWRPPVTPRPPDGKPLTEGEVFLLWLDSVSTVRINGFVTPENAPLTPDEADRAGAYLRRTLGGSGAETSRPRGMWRKVPGAVACQECFGVTSFPTDSRDSPRTPHETETEGEIKNRASDDF